MTIAADTIARASRPGCRSARNAAGGEASADAAYFAGRMHASVARAEASADSLARLIHFELAGRYSVAALAARHQPGATPCQPWENTR